MSDTRSERDSLGTLQVPADRLWGAQTQRALEHFRISSETMPGPLILALAEVKRACAQVNQDLGWLDPALGQALSLIHISEPTRPY